MSSSQRTDNTAKTSLIPKRNCNKHADSEYSIQTMTNSDSHAFDITEFVNKFYNHDLSVETKRRDYLTSSST